MMMMVEVLLILVATKTTCICDSITTPTADLHFGESHLLTPTDVALHATSRTLFVSDQ